MRSVPPARDRSGHLKVRIRILRSDLRPSCLRRHRDAENDELSTAPPPRPAAASPLAMTCSLSLLVAVLLFLALAGESKPAGTLCVGGAAAAGDSPLAGEVRLVAAPNATGLTGCRGHHGHFPLRLPATGSKIDAGDSFSDMCIVGACPFPPNGTNASSGVAAGPVPALASASCMNVSARFKSLDKDAYRIRAIICEEASLKKCNDYCDGCMKAPGRRNCQCDDYTGGGEERFHAIMNNTQFPHRGYLGIEFQNTNVLEDATIELLELQIEPCVY